MADVAVKKEVPLAGLLFSYIVHLLVFMLGFSMTAQAIIAAFWPNLIELEPTDRVIVLGIGFLLLQRVVHKL